MHLKKDMLMLSTLPMLLQGLKNNLGLKMKQFEMDCYEVRETDGGGTNYDAHVCFVSSLSLADAVCAKQKGWRHHSKYTKTYTIFETIEEIEANSKANLRKSALAKLTNLEKEALGLK